MAQPSLLILAHDDEGASLRTLLESAFAPATLALVTSWDAYRETLTGEDRPAASPDLVIVDLHGFDPACAAELPALLGDVPAICLLPADQAPPVANPTQLFLPRPDASAFDSTVCALVGQKLAYGSERSRRQWLERALRASTNQLEQVITGSHSIVFSLDLNGRLRAINPAFTAITGWPVGEWIGKSLVELVHADEQVNFAVALSEAAAGVTQRLPAVRLRTRADKWAVTEITITPYPQADGQNELFAMARDVTRHVQALRALSRERDRMAILFEALPATISWISANLNYLAVNKQLAALHGLQPADYVGRPLGFDSPEAGPQIRAFVAELFANEDPEGKLELNVEVNGNVKYFLIVAHKYRQGEEIVLVGVDITEIKRTERAQRRQLAELSVLQAVSTAGAQATDEDSLIAEATEIIGTSLYPDNFGVLLWDEGSDFLRVHPSYQLRDKVRLFEIPLAESVTGQVAACGLPARIDDIAALDVYWSGDPATRSELCVPLRVGDRVIGVINAESTRLANFTDDDERLLTTIAGQLAIAIERLRREANERRQARQLATIFDVSRQISSILDMPTLLNEIVSLLARNLKLYNAAIAFIEGDRLVFQAGYGGYGGDGTFVANFAPSVTHPLFAGAIDNGQALLIEDVTTLGDDLKFQGLPMMRAHLAVPLRRQGSVSGILAVSSWEPNGITQGDGELLELLADHVSIALENARLYQAVSEQAQELSGLYDTALVTGGILDKERLVDQLYAQVSDLMDPDVFLVALYDEEANQMEVVRAVEEDLPIREWDGLRLNLKDGGLTGWVMQRRNTLYIEDLQSQGLPAEPRTTGQPVRSWLGVPLLVGDWLIGALSLQSFTPRQFSRSQRRFVESVANQISLALRNAQLFEQAGHRAQQLTRLNELTSSISGLLRATDMVEAVSHHLVEEFGYQVAAVQGFGPLTDLLPQTGIFGGRADGQQRQLVSHLEDEAVRLAIEGGETVHVDVFDPLPLAAEKTATLSAAVFAPLRVGGQVLGMLGVGSTTLRRFAEAELTLVKTVADQLAVALEKARLFAETTRRAGELETLTQISALLRATRTVDDVLPLVMPKVLEIVSGVQAELYLVEPESGDLVRRAMHPPERRGGDRRQSVDVGVTGYVARTGNVRVSPVLREDPLFFEAGEESSLCDPLGSVVSLPVRAGERVIGVLHVGLDQVREFTPDEIRLLTAVADITGSALYRAQVMEGLEAHVAQRTQELALANERLKGLDKLKSKFVSDISHELRTPISNLRLYSDLLEKGKPEKRPHYLNVLRRETLRLVDIVEPILNYSQIGQDLLEARLEPIALNSIVSEVVQERQSEAAGRGITLAQDLDPALPIVMADRRALHRMASNLMENAVTYANGGTVALRTFVDGDSHMVCLEVRDEGVGISDADLPYIFEWFYRGMAAGQSNIPGAGLGLATVKATVEQFGGQVAVESAVGVGSTFRILLPAHHPPTNGHAPA